MIIEVNAIMWIVKSNKHICKRFLYIVEFWHFTQKKDLLNEMCRNTIYEENHLQNFLYVNCHILNSDSLHSKF